MAKFLPAFEELIKNEGGYVNDSDDSGGETYKGVARNFHSKWMGWSKIDVAKSSNGFPKCLENNNDLQSLVSSFYEVEFWDKIRGDNITNQNVAECIFDFAVNGGWRTSGKIAQLACGAKVDGVIGDNTLLKLNAVDQEVFILRYKFQQIARYIHIVERNPKNRKYFYGWIRRALGEN
ncbi:MAG: N-acetylmuramidase [Alteromonadaceae bacterium]|nr:N-acetylmuramidase [Alteromonadaceae bacterium]